MPIYTDQCGVILQYISDTMLSKYILFYYKFLFYSFFCNCFQMGDESTKVSLTYTPRPRWQTNRYAPNHTTHPLSLPTRTCTHALALSPCTANTSIWPCEKSLYRSKPIYIKVIILDIPATLVQYKEGAEQRQTNFH